MAVQELVALARPRFEYIPRESSQDLRKRLGLQIKACSRYVGYLSITCKPVSTQKARQNSLQKTSSISGQTTFGSDFNRFSFNELQTSEGLRAYLTLLNQGYNSTGYSAIAQFDVLQARASTELSKEYVQAMRAVHCLGIGELATALSKFYISYAMLHRQVLLADSELLNVRVRDGELTGFSIEIPVDVSSPAPSLRTYTPDNEEDLWRAVTAQIFRHLDEVIHLSPISRTKLWKEATERLASATALVCKNLGYLDRVESVFRAIQDAAPGVLQFPIPWICDEQGNVIAKARGVCCQMCKTTDAKGMRCEPAEGVEICPVPRKIFAATQGSQGGNTTKNSR